MDRIDWVTAGGRALVRLLSVNPANLVIVRSHFIRRHSTSGEVFEQADHVEGGFGAFAALVAVGAAGAGEGLLHRLAGEDAQAARGRRCRGAMSAEGEADAAVDVLVVRRFAADDGAEAEDGGVAAAVGEPLGGERDFPRAGDPGDVDVRRPARRPRGARRRRLRAACR